MAQTAPAPSPSPFAAGDLKRPIFDTSKPAYDTADVREKSASSVVAEIDGRAVTLGQVGDAIADLPANVQTLPFVDLFPIVLSQLIRQQALVIRAHRLALDEDPAVQRRIRTATDRVLASAVLEEEASRTITEADLLDRYKKDVAGKPGPEEAQVRVIMTATEDEAIAITAELRAGADFASIARRSSKDATAPVAGDAGFVTRDGLTPEIGAVVFALPAGQMTQFPVRSASAWFVLKVEERRRQGRRAFGLAREELRQVMLREHGADVVATALKDVTVREFDIMGKEVESPDSAGSRTRDDDGRINNDRFLKKSSNSVKRNSFSVYISVRCDYVTEAAEGDLLGRSFRPGGFMRRFRTPIAAGFAFCAFLAAADPLRAQTVFLNPLANGSFIYGDTSFTITGCTFNGGACGAADNAEIVGLFNGRNGTEIQIKQRTGSAIYANVAGAPNTNLSFHLAVTPRTGSRGPSAIQNTIAGSDGRSSENILVSSVLGPVSGVTSATGSGTSNLASAVSKTSFSLTQSPINFNVSLAVNSAAVTGADTLTLRNVTLLFTPAPEPASMALFATGLAGLTVARHRCKKRRDRQRVLA